MLRNVPVLGPLVDCDGLLPILQAVSDPIQIRYMRGKLKVLYTIVLFYINNLISHECAK